MFFFSSVEQLSGASAVLSLKGTPYWMAPEVFFSPPNISSFLGAIAFTIHVPDQSLPNTGDPGYDESGRGVRSCC